MTDKTIKICQLAKKRAAEREKEVLKTIEQMKTDKTDVNYSSVAKATGAARSYLYKNKKISSAIRSCTPENKARSKTSEEVLTKALKQRITQLEAELKKYKEHDYKALYEAEKTKNGELEKQLTEAYKF